MLRASLYILLCSFRNRLRVRLQRLKQPRYFVGAIAGAAYLYFSFFARFRVSRAGAGRRQGRPSRLPAALTAVLALAPALGGLALMVIALLAWLFPVNSGLLEFSDAELQFLLPAPVSRRQLLVHRLLRSQLGMLFSAVIVGLVSPTAFGFSRLRIAVAAWLLFVTAKLYFTGVTLSRARLGAGRTRIRGLAWLPLGVVGVALAIVAGTIGFDWRRTPPGDAMDALLILGGVAHHRLGRLVLLPFMALAQPLFAEWPQPYLIGIAGSVVVMLFVAMWVVLSDDAFQDAVSDIAERRGQEPTNAGAGTYKVRSAGWALAPLGRPETAFAWKAALQTLRSVDRRSLVRVIAIVIALTVVAASLGRANGLASLLGAFALAGTAFAILLAPQVLRIDMRQDLAHLELLKTWPVKASAVLRGELLWPGVVITAAAWAMLAIATSLSGTILTQVSAGLRLSGGAAIAILAPALVFAQLTIHNLVALIFPAWVPLGHQRPRGLDAMGQRLIMLGGTWLLLILSLLPGAMAGAVVWFALHRLAGDAALVPAAIVCTMMTGVEVLLATEVMGPAYDRLDVLAVERVE